MMATSTATHRPPHARTADPSAAIAVLSWAWAAVSLDAVTRTATQPDGWTPARWLAAHPSDAGLVAHLAGQLS
jgi:hypothetical protein